MTESWAQTLNNWEQQRLDKDAPYRLRPAADRILTTLDPTSANHRMFAELVLTLPPFYPVAEEISFVNALLFELDADPVQLLLDEWRAQTGAK